MINILIKIISFGIAFVLTFVAFYLAIWVYEFFTKTYREEILQDLDITHPTDRKAFSGKDLIIKRTYSNGTSKIIHRKIRY